jgi:hypothetical protein
MYRDDKHLEADLRRLMHVSAPSGLADRIFSATADHLTAAGVDQHDLRRALEVKAPPGLAQRVYESTLGRRTPAGRNLVFVCFNWAARQTAIAASITLFIIVGLFLAAALKYQSYSDSDTVAQRQPPKPLIDVAWIHSELSSLERMLNQSAAPTPDSPLDAQIMALSAEVDQTTLSMACYVVGENSLDQSTETLADDLNMLEAQIRAY